MSPVGSWSKGNILPFKTPTWQPVSKKGNVAMLLACTLITAAVSFGSQLPISTLGVEARLMSKPSSPPSQMQGYDGAMMGGMNILPQYTEYFQLTTATRSLNIATNYVGGALSVSDALTDCTHAESQRIFGCPKLSCVTGSLETNQDLQCLCWGWVTDVYSRRFGLFWSAMITVFAAILQGAAQHIAMFCVARILIGFGTTASVISGSAYLAETLPWEYRVWGLSLFDDFFYVGALVAAGVTYTSFRLDNTWAWRLPSLVQGIWGLWCVALLPWMPESPRWLMDQGQTQEALLVLAQTNANGNIRDDIVRLQFRQIYETIEYERDPMSSQEVLRNRGARKRLIITATCALFSMLTGNIFVMYNIGKMLSSAGVNNEGSQLLVVSGLVPSHRMPHITRPARMNAPSQS